jgi:hypothetical protein
MAEYKVKMFSIGTWNTSSTEDKINEWYFNNKDIEIIDISNNKTDSGVIYQIVTYKVIGRKEKLEHLDSINDE